MGYMNMQLRRTRCRPRAGLTIIYLTAFLTVGIGFCSLAVDVGRVQVAKTQLTCASDAAARAGALYLGTGGSTSSTCRSNAAAAALANSCDGVAVVVSTSSTAHEIDVGKWNAGTSTFTTGSTPYNAVRVQASRTATKGNAIPLFFESVIGLDFCDIHATSIATFAAATNSNSTVQATANPFLAGMPNGSTASVGNPHNNPDHAGNSFNWKQSPLVVPITLTPGMQLTFANISGSSGNSPGDPGYQPDGDTSTIVTNYTGNDNGIANTNAPINSVVGIFLDDTQPNSTSAPSSLDFTSSASRDFSTLSPQIKQVFFIGDGQNSSGQDQIFVVPQGATRLYLANWDAYEWNNNNGYRNVQITIPMTISLVQ